MLRLVLTSAWIVMTSARVFHNNEMQPSKRHGKTEPCKKPRCKLCEMISDRTDLAVINGFKIGGRYHLKWQNQL